MFISGTKQTQLEIHINATDAIENAMVGENIRITLSADKAKELEDRLEEALKR